VPAIAVPGTQWRIFREAHSPRPGREERFRRTVVSYRPSFRSPRSSSLAPYPIRKHCRICRAPIATFAIPITSASRAVLPRRSLTAGWRGGVDELPDGRWSPRRPARAVHSLGGVAAQSGLQSDRTGGRSCGRRRERSGVAAETGMRDVPKMATGARRLRCLEPG
jgi:hypothetical protein